MPKAPIPENEQARLAELQGHDILDTLPEQVYDDLARIAALICNVPIAAVSLVDSDRQWFKAIVGLDAKETSRDVAFCAYAILGPDTLMEVRDASEDVRFSDNPLVTKGPNIRFYAGVPLTTMSGLALGMLCVVDQKPRVLSEEQKEALKALARQVVDQLSLRREIRLLEEMILGLEGPAKSIAGELGAW